MKNKFILLIVFLVVSCTNSKEFHQAKNNDNAIQIVNCNYTKEYEEYGNRIIDTIKIGKRVVDPIDDLTNFEKTDFGFVTQGSRVFKKAKTHRRCGKTFIDVEYYQDLTGKIDLASYKEYKDPYFATKNGVNFWWVNSGGHMIIPIEKADPKTFKPFEDMCGGIDKNGIYYGCPNKGVYQLNIPLKSKFKFVAKNNNYWNSPKHYVLINKEVYDVKYTFDKGYFCELDTTMSIKDL